MNQWLRRILIAVFAAIFLISGYHLVNYFVQAKQNQNMNDHLAGLVGTNKPADTQDSTNNTTNDPTDDPTDGTTDPPPLTDPPAPEVMGKYQKLYEMNKDLVGWIKIEGTKVDLPVLQTPDRPNYYLYRDFYGNYQSEDLDFRPGSLYVGEAFDVFTPSDNVVIYGHNMRDYSMFGCLLYYDKEGFYKYQPTFTFDTLYEEHTYQIFAVFRTSANPGEGFAYHTFVNAANAAEFDKFVSTCKELSLYDTGVTAQYGDKLLTLSTCEYTQDNGRFVVVAKRIK